MLFRFGFAGRNANPNGKSTSALGSKSGTFDASKASGSRTESRKPNGNAIGYRYPAVDNHVC